MPQKIHSKIFYWTPTFTCALAIFILSSHSSVKTTEFYLGDFLVKKTAHIVEYTILSLLIYRSLKNTTNLNKTQLILWTLLLSVMYAISDEIHQTFVPTRTGKVRDVGIDTIGISFCVVFVAKIVPTLPPNLKQFARRLNLTG